MTNNDLQTIHIKYISKINQMLSYYCRHSIVCEKSIRMLSLNVVEIKYCVKFRVKFIGFSFDR